MLLPDDLSPNFQRLLEILVDDPHGVELRVFRAQGRPPSLEVRGVRWFAGVTLHLALYAHDNSLAVMNIVVDRDKRGQGLGRKALARLTAASDQFMVPMQLFPRAHDRSPLNSAQLSDWYKRHGFKKIPGGMWRKPETPGVSQQRTRSHRGPRVR